MFTNITDKTPDGEFLTTFESIVREVKLPIRIVERSWDSMKEMIAKSNPFKYQLCECEVCQLGRKGVENLYMN